MLEEINWDLADIITPTGYLPSLRIQNQSEKYIWSSCHIQQRRAACYTKIGELFKEGMYTDVNIICQNQIFKCHRVALAAASEYFHLMFRGNFLESHAQDITLQDIDCVTFEQILHFIYRGEIAVINDDNVFNLLRASEIYCLKEIEEFCVHYLTQKSIPMDDALEIYLFATATHKVLLIPAISQFILQHLDHFCQESKFLRMSSDDFCTLVAYFNTTSASQEIRILDAILRWVQHSSTDISAEDIRSSYLKYTQKVQFNWVPATDIEDYFVRKFFNNDAKDECSEKSVALDLGSGVKTDKFQLHVYVVASGGGSNPTAIQTSIFSLQNEGRISWPLNRTIRPAIEGMRLVESAGRLYCFKTCANGQCSFSRSTDVDLFTNEQFLASPACWKWMPAHSMDVRFSSLCRFQKNIYLSYSFKNIFFQSYNTQLDSWSPIPTVSESFKPQNLISDDTRLYVLGESYNSSWLEGPNRFIAYDPRVGKMDQLNFVKNLYKFYVTEPGIFHKDRIYFPRYDKNGKYGNNSLIAIYDIVSGRWDAQRLQRRPCDMNRLVSFNDRLWLLGICNKSPGGCAMSAMTYDSYLQEWDWEKHSCKLSDGTAYTIQDVVAFW